MNTRFTLSLLLLCSAVSHAADITPSAPELSATSYVLMDAASGQILASKEADKQVEPASLTKMMTSYVISYEVAKGNIKNEDMVVISDKAWAKNFPDSSLMFLEVGTQVSVDDLHKGIIIQSGNDASVAMAEHIAGSEGAFAEVMNNHAKRLGLSHTHFVNSTGLPDPNHYTTAHDMALLGRALIVDFPGDYQLYSIKEFIFNKIKQINRNSLLWDPTLKVDGIKTGHTSGAGYCLVTSSEQGGMRLITAVMGTPSQNARKADSKSLLTYGFRFFESIKLESGQKELSQQPVWMGRDSQVGVGLASDLNLVIPRGKKDQLKLDYQYQPNLHAPISQGQKLGELVIHLKDKEIGRYELQALKAVDEGSWWQQLIDFIRLKFKDWFGW